MPVTIQVYPQVATGGSGANVVTITVTDDVAASLAGARVRVTSGLFTYVQTTDVNGQCSFSLDDGNWTVSITLAGYQFTPVLLVVDGPETPTYAMTPIIIIPPDQPEAITAIYHLSNKSLDDDAGVEVFFRMITPPHGDGEGYEKDWSSAQTTPEGIASIPVLPGAEYELAIASVTGCKLRTLIPLDAQNGHLLAENATYLRP